MRKSTSILANLDWVSVLLYLALVLLGWGNIYAAVYNEEHQSIFDLSQKYGKQMLWILTSLMFVLIIMVLDSSLYQTLAYPIYIASLISLVLVLIIGTEISGARSWFTLGSFSLQPAEFAKAATALAVARYLSGNNVNLKRFGYQLAALTLVFLPALMILPQPDPGSALVYTAFFLVLYREGLPGTYLAIGFTLVALFILSLLLNKLYLFLGLAVMGAVWIYFTRRARGWWWRIALITIFCGGFVQSVDYTFNNLLEDRHRNRINILLGKAHDPQGIGYNTHQSMIAIGSGGFSGKGYLQGTQTKYDFVPEQSTDFIFCTVGEEWGFMGTTAVVLLFVLFLLRLVWLAERQKSAFSRIYGYGVVSILFFHFVINIAMTIGLAPVIGIPLPFFSYGGSSLWGFTILLFIFLKLDTARVHIW